MPVGCLVVIVWWDACIGWASPQPVCGLNLANSCSSWSAQNIRNCYQKCYQKSEINGNLPTPDDQGGWFPFIHFNCQILCLCFSANRFLSVKKKSNMKIKKWIFKGSFHKMPLCWIRIMSEKKHYIHINSTFHSGSRWLPLLVKNWPS